MIIYTKDTNTLTIIPDNDNFNIVIKKGSTIKTIKFQDGTIKENCDMLGTNIKGNNEQGDIKGNNRQWNINGDNIQRNIKGDNNQQDILGTNNQWNIKGNNIQGIIEKNNKQSKIYGENEQGGKTNG